MKNVTNGTNGTNGTLVEEDITCESSETGPGCGTWNKWEDADTTRMKIKHSQTISTHRCLPPPSDEGRVKDPPPHLERPEIVPGNPSLDIAPGQHSLDTRQDTSGALPLEIRSFIHLMVNF